MPYTSPAGEVALNPVRVVILAPRRTRINGPLRIGADAALIIDHAVRAVFGHEIIGCNSFLNPVDKRFQRIRLVTTGASATVSHSRKQEETNLFSCGIHVSRES